MVQLVLAGTHRDQRKPMMPLFLGTHMSGQEEEEQELRSCLFLGCDLGQ